MAHMGAPFSDIPRMKSSPVGSVHSEALCTSQIRHPDLAPGGGARARMKWGAQVTLRSPVN